MEKWECLVSVIVPIYNMEPYLDRCLQSILRQTYTNLEVLAIDDGSIDDSLRILLRYQQQDARIRAFHQENRGVSAARNLGLEQMRGMYCTFVDADDFVAEQYIEWLYLAMQQTHTGLAICNGQIVFSSKAMPAGSLQGKPTIQEIPLDAYSLWGEASHVVCWGALYRKEVIEGLCFDTSLYIGEDILYFFNALLKCDRIAFIKERPYFYV